MKSDALLNMTPAEMAALSTSDLAEMQAEVADATDRAKSLKSLLDHAINEKFRTQIEQKYAEKHTGTAHIHDGDYDLEINVPKKIDWDQALLKKAEAQIVEWGDDPEEYISVTRKVSETAWKSWPSRLKEMFADARTEGTAKPQFKITRKENK